MPRIRVTKFQEMKLAGERIATLTAYDYPSAKAVAAAGIPLILVGDSMGNVVLGFDSTVRVTMDDMVRHAQAVVRGAGDAFVVVDMPFMSYQVSVEDSIRNAGRLVAEGGAHAVKLEGGKPVVESVRRIVEAGIPVMGHLGLTPQSVNALGGYRIQGRTLREAQRLIEDAEALEKAGAFSIVLEGVPGPLAEVLTKRLRIPTIGIGAGAGCDGQIQVFHDILGFSDRTPKHAKVYANLNKIVQDAVSTYAAEVKSGSFPGAEQTTQIDDAVLKELLGGATTNR